MGLVYRIGEVATLLNLKTYVLRFWETEFSQVKPLRTDTGQRLYTQKDVELLRRIQFLLHEQGLTIDGARKILARGKKAELSKEAQAGYAALGIQHSFEEQQYDEVIDSTTLNVPNYPSAHGTGKVTDTPPVSLPINTPLPTDNQTTLDMIREIEEIADILRGK